MKKANRFGAFLSAFMAMMLGCSSAFAAGVDTGSTSMASMQTWMMTWIPIAAVVMIIVSALAWIAHLIRMDFAVRLVVGLILIGSASYLVGLFGL